MTAGTTSVSRRTVLALAGACAAPRFAAAASQKVLRIAFPVAETGFDPVQLSDLYSRQVTAHIFDGLYRFDYLARPFRLRAQTADGEPQVSSDFRTWTFRLRRGIRFADDPAFGGRPRELTAADYVYSWKRFFDPALKAAAYAEMEEQGISGMAALRERAMKPGQRFDYDTEVEGLRALDRYTLQVKLDEPRPRFVEVMAQGDLYGALAREVVEAAGGDTTARPVGTGPFVLKEWRRSSFIALERNPNYREELYDEQPADGDAEAAAIRTQLKGRRLPMVDRVEISIIDENQPRWLAFLNRQIDVTAVPLEFTAQAVPNGVLAPNLAKQGVQHRRMPSPDVIVTYFNMEDPVVGGYTADKVALRRAIALSLDIPREIEIGWRGQAIPAQSGIPPHTYGYDPLLKTESGDYDPARAKALLDLYGYVDRNGDGWRELPDGRPLVLQMGGTPDQISRQFDELWKKCWNAVGLRVEFRIAQWPEQLKAARAGKLMMWNLGGTASQPDGQDFLQRMYGPASGGQNLARFRMAGFDQIFNRMSLMPDGEERLALFRREIEFGLAYMPYKYHVHRVANDLSHPWVLGYRRPLFTLTQWQFIDIDDSRRPGADS